MTATDELRRMLDERGVEWKEGSPNKTKWSHDGIEFVAVNAWPRNGGKTRLILHANLTPEQAIAATLGSELPYDELLRCLENDWHISASWDGLRKFWCIELTEEGVKLRNPAHVTLTAEQVMGIAGKHQPDYCSDTHVCFDWQAIADELNATLGNGTCENISDPPEGFYCSSCGWGDFAEPSHLLTTDKFSDNEFGPNYCPNCGRKVVDE